MRNGGDRRRVGDDVRTASDANAAAGLGWGEAFEVSRHSLRTIPFDSMSFADNRIEAGVEELTHVTLEAMWRSLRFARRSAE